MCKRSDTARSEGPAELQWGYRGKAPIVIFTTPLRRVTPEWVASFVEQAGSRQAALRACTVFYSELKRLADQSLTAKYRGRKVYRIDQTGDRIDFIAHLFRNVLSGPMGSIQIIQDKIKRMYPE